MQYGCSKMALLLAGDLSVHWQVSTDPPDCMYLGERRGPFSFVTNQTTACYSALFESPVDAFGYQNVCFYCDREVPNLGLTWGALRALYR